MQTSQGLKDAPSVRRFEQLEPRYVLVSTPVVQMIERAAEGCAGLPENGGILLGSLRGPHLECTGFTTAGHDDERSYGQFVRKDAIHQQAAERAWLMSSHTVTFIGEWHTHPEGPPIPSSIDKKSWCKLAQSVRHPMLLLIAAPRAWNGFVALPGAVRASVRPLAHGERAESGVVLSW